MSTQSRTIYEFGPFHLDLTDHLLSRNGKLVPLTPKAFEVLVCLLERRGHLVEKDRMMQAVWADSFVEEGNVSRTVWMRRNALGDDRNGHKYIKTVPKLGYRFVADVRVTERESSISDLENLEPEPTIKIPVEYSTSDELLDVKRDHGPSVDLNFSPVGGLGNGHPVLQESVSPNLIWRRYRISVLFIISILAITVALVLIAFLRRSGTSADSNKSIEALSLKNNSPRNGQAKDAYLRGLSFCSEAHNSKTSSEADLRYKSGLESLELAVGLEQSWAEAQGELADCYIWQAASDASYYPKAKAAALTAIKLDDSSVKAHHAMGFALWRADWDRAGAEREFDRAVELNENGKFGLPGYALFLSSDGRSEEAIRAMEQASSIDPYNYVTRQNLGFTYLRARQYNSAIEKFETAIEIYPKQYLAQIGLGETLACAGRYDEAIAVTQKAIENSADPMPKTDDRMKALRLAWIYAKFGHRKEAVKILDEVKQLPEPPPGSINVIHFAMVYAELGDKDNAFAWLRKAFDSHSQTLVWLKMSPEFERLHGDTRYVEMLERLGLRP